MRGNRNTDEINWPEALRSDRERTLTRLYRQAFPMVRHHVLRNQGTEQDAKDLFQDALILFYEKAVSDQLVLTASASTYLVSICRNRWLRELERRSRRAHLEDDDQADTAPLPDELRLASEKDTPSLSEYVERLGDKCRSILTSFYYFRQSMEQIAEKHQYRNVRSATVQKFKCLERLRKSVSEVLLETFYH
jgi:RNA polymerase sigma factor (sigma-70 family)